MSVNEAWQGRRYKTEEYKAYEKALEILLPEIEIPEGKLKLELEFGLSNAGSDWDNPIKPTVDILCKRYGFNDNRIYEAVVRKKKCKKNSEYFMFDIKGFT